MVERSRASANARREWAKIPQVVLVFGAVLALAGPSARGTVMRLHYLAAEVDAVESLKFDTDDCGSVARVESGRSVLGRSSASDGFDDEDEGEDEDLDRWANAWGMSDGATALAEQWMLQHPQVAIVTNAVEKSCGADPVDEHDTGTSGIA